MYICMPENVIGDSHRVRPVYSSFRIFNASPNTPAVDVYINGRLIIQGISYRHVTGYYNVPSGNYTMSIYISGQKLQPLLRTNLYLPDNTVFNGAIIGLLPNIEVYPIPEPVTKQTFKKACIRFIHLSPTTSEVDVSLNDGTSIFKNVDYKYITNYACIPSGTYTFNIKTAGTQNKLLTTPTLQLKEDSYYSVYIIGMKGSFPSIGTLPLLEPRR